MKNLNSNELTKAIKSNRIKLIVALLFLVSTAILIYIGYKEQHGVNEVKTSMQEIEGKEDNLEGQEAYIKVSMEPYVFATYEHNGKEDDYKYYLVMDKNDYLYVAFMSSNDYLKLKNTSLDKTIKISGITEKIETDIKELAIKAYNEELGEEYLTLENFDEYVGPILLNTTISYDDSLIYYILSLVSFCFFMLIFYLYITIELKNKKVLKNYSKEELEKIGMQIYSLTNNPYKDMKLYLTKQYLVDLSNGIVILNYDDLVWVYPYTYRYNGLLINKSLKVITNKNQTFDVANTKLTKEDKEEKLNAILNTLKKKNPNLKTEYTKENKKEVKAKFKEEKKNKKKEKRHKKQEQK